MKLDEAEEVAYNNGKEEVKIMAYPLEFEADKEPMVRNKKEGGEEE